MSDRVVLGWREWVALPDLGIARLRAKVDTGARSSALHVDAHWRFVEGGAPWVGFRLHARRRQPHAIEACAPLHDEREVADSGGHRSRRLFLRTTLRLAGHERMIELNLCDRRGMLFPMLLGRSALDGLFVVDPSRSFVHGRARRATDAVPQHAGASIAIDLAPTVPTGVGPFPANRPPLFRIFE
ncbi:MAG: ATP-dependent zinc protease [Lysobacter sp.]|nr:ATP-dependent zinc protease [Lysobacter sp.]